jgi:hypothetical protein
MPRPNGKHATLPMRRSLTPSEASDRAVAKMSYRLLQWSEGKNSWLTLAGFQTIEPALEAGPLRGGDVKVINKRGETVVRWVNGRQAT